MFVFDFWRKVKRMTVVCRHITSSFSTMELLLSNIFKKESRIKSISSHSSSTFCAIRFDRYLWNVPSKNNWLISGLRRTILFEATQTCHINSNLPCPACDITPSLMSIQWINQEHAETVFRPKVAGSSQDRPTPSFASSAVCPPKPGMDTYIFLPNLSIVTQWGYGSLRKYQARQRITCGYYNPGSLQRKFHYSLPGVERSEHKSLPRACFSISSPDFLGWIQE